LPAEPDGRSAKEAAVSEQQRTNFYNLLREQTDEQTAEFVMSCLAPAPLSDLVTKEHLSAEFSKFALKMAEQREADRKEHAAQRDADRKEWATLREADRKDHAAQRDADRTEVRHQFRWLVGIGVTILGVVVAFGVFA
jgi:hypothetical protein